VNRLALVLAVGLTAGGLWISRGLGSFQIWLFGAGLAGLIGIAAESFLERHGLDDSGWLRHGATAWITAALLVAPGVWLVDLMPESVLPVAGGMALVTGALLLALREGLMPQSRFHQHGRFLSNLIFYLLTFLLFALIYQTKLRGSVTATSAGLVASLVGLELLRSGTVGREIDRKLVIQAALAGLMVGETTLALNYWPVGGLVGGALLLLSFYVVVGLLQCIRDGSLRRNTLLEYGAVGAAGLLAVLVAVP
jgi:hypothetical protein